jgi:thiol-disulfide isomerase/thioredoxin
LLYSNLVPQRMLPRQRWIRLGAVALGLIALPSARAEVDPSDAAAPKPTNSSGSPASPSRPNSPARPKGQLIPLSPVRLQFIRQALPLADHACEQRIEPGRLSPADRNNDTYLTLYDRANQVIGYVRDFVGPVSPNQACPCNPLNLSLVFRPDHRLQTILAAAPLQKWGHEAMSEQEFARLIELMQQLPAALCAVPTVEDMVDATTGATRQALADVVVHHAALSTRRIAGLVTETREILQNAPIDPHRQRLLNLIDAPLAPAARAKALARLVMQVPEQGLRLQAFHQMVQAYTEALRQGQAGLPQVERTLLDFAVLCEGGGNEVSQACLKVAETRRRPAFVERCANHLKGARARGIAPQTRELLLGTAYFMDNAYARALPLLLRAAESRTAKDSPELFLRIAKAQVFCGKQPAARATLQLLLREHPLIPDGLATLQAANGGASLESLAHITAATQESFLGEEVHLGGLPQHVPLRDAEGKTVDLSYADPQQVTVLVFFATWCPHCQAELPHLKAFVEAQSSRPGAPKVRLLAVRTAIEKETDAARAFWRGFAPNFAVYEDGDMSHAFSEFARATGRPTMLPTTAVIDSQGIVRYFVEPGLYRDIRAELGWATAAAAAAAGPTSP